MPHLAPLSWALYPLLLTAILYLHTVLLSFHTPCSWQSPSNTRPHPPRWKWK